jgi:hypothetical protein
MPGGCPNDLRSDLVQIHCAFIAAVVKRFLGRPFQAARRFGRHPPPVEPVA